MNYSKHLQPGTYKRFGYLRPILGDREISKFSFLERSFRFINISIFLPECNQSFGKGKSIYFSTLGDARTSITTSISRVLFSYTTWRLLRVQEVLISCLHKDRRAENHTFYNQYPSINLASTHNVSQCFAAPPQL